MAPAADTAEAKSPKKGRPTKAKKDEEEEAAPAADDAEAKEPPKKGRAKKAKKEDEEDDGLRLSELPCLCRALRFYLLPGQLPAAAVNERLTRVCDGQWRTTPTLGSTGRFKRAGSDSANPLSTSRWRRPSLRRK